MPAQGLACAQGVRLCPAVECLQTLQHCRLRSPHPTQGVHAVQLEMTQSSYMQESWPFDYLPAVAEGVQPHVRRMLEAVLAFVET